MRYAMPNFPCDFEIPDDWLTSAGIQQFTPTSEAFRSSTAAVLVPLKEIEPPLRVNSVSKDWRGFDRDRLISVLSGIVADAEIEPVVLLELPHFEFAPNTYRFRVCNGFHRFYASIIAHFSHLPATI